MATSQATENNQKLFDRYGKRLALSDPLVYTSYADKLSLWLSDFKAYYTAARPQIVKLLLIAQVTLRRALGLAEHLNSPFNISQYSEHPMVKSYIRLVKTVEPFESFFTEPGLLVHIRSSLTLVSPHAPGGNQPITHVQSDIQTLSHIPESLTSPTSYVSETQIIESSSDTMATAPHILPVVAKAQFKTKKKKVVDFNLLVQRDIKALLEKQGNQGDSSQHGTEESMISLSSLGDPLSFKKASSIVEFQNITPQDTCEDQKMASPDPVIVFLSSQDMIAAAEPKGTSSPALADLKMVGPDQIMEPLPSPEPGTAAELPSSHICEDKKLATSDQITEPLPSQDLSIASESQGHSSLIAEDHRLHQIMTPLPSQNISAAAEPQRPSSTCEDQIMVAPDQITKFLPSQDSIAAAEPRGTSSSACEDQIMATPDQVMEPIPLQDTNVDTRGTSSQVVAEDRETIPPSSVKGPSVLQQPIGPQDHSSQTVPQDQEMESGDTMVSLPSLDACIAAEPQNLSWHPIGEEQEKREMVVGSSADLAPPSLNKSSSSIETQGSAAMSIDEESITASLHSFSQSKARNLTPTVASDHVGNISSPVQCVLFSTPPASADRLIIGSDHNRPEGKFGQDMHIVAYRKGLKKECTMSFTCNISGDLFPKVSAWLNRNIFSLNIEDSLCLSLGCYSIADLQLQQASVQNNCTALEQRTSVAQSHWPQSGLSMNVQFKNGREELPLSPPFQVTPDGLVDVSQFLLAGQNAIKLKQTTDMSQYIFVLHSHKPTLAQLREVDRRRQRDREWREWTHYLTRPLDIPSKPVLQT